MSTERETLRLERLALKQKYGALFATVSEVLFEADLQGINFGSNTDEYDSEAGTILPRLEHASNEREVAAIVHEEFSRWFGPEDIGTEEDYVAVGKQIWAAWCAFLQRDA